MRGVEGVRSATVFGQSMHLLVNDAITRADIEKKLLGVGIQGAEIHVIGPSLEDVFVALTAKYAEWKSSGEGGLSAIAVPNLSSRAGAARRGTSQIVVKAYFVYMMTNRTTIVLYTGVTNDLARRVWEHENGTFRGFTKRYRLTILVYHETYHDICDAIAREKEIKGWRRSQKECAGRNHKLEVDRSFAKTFSSNCEIPRRLRGSG